GGNGWGNDELEYYTPRKENASTNGSGALVITERAETYTGPDGVTRDYTSARMNTSGRFQPAYGQFEARMRIPRGQGMWRAFWRLGANIGSVGWPGCGEIDIMENIGRQPKTVWGSMHGPGFFGGNAKNGSVDAAAPLADDFHAYTVEWEKDA